MEEADKNRSEISDMDGFSANDDHKEHEGKTKTKRKRRKREIDMIKIEDDGSNDDDSASEDMCQKKMAKIGSPGPYSPSHSGVREPRSCVLKASQKRKPLSRLLEQLLRNLEKKDPHQFFAWPVNDNFAPGYSDIIKKPMDFSSIKQKIDENEYRSLNCFISDFKLMCNNAMKYNKAGTIYHKAARRLLHVGLKQLTPAKLRPLGNILTYMYEIPIRELGFDIGKMDVVLKQNSPVKSEEDPPSDSGEMSEPKQEQLKCEDEVKIKMEAAREQHRKRLARKAFPRMDNDGKTSLCILVDHVDFTIPVTERPVSLGNFVGKLQQGSGSLHSFREDRRNFVKGVKPLNYGPFSSYAPSFDSTFASLTKEESHLLYHTLATETGNSNEDLLRFGPESPWACIYDMELMFPGAQKDDMKNNDDDIAHVKVDVEQLRSLSELGIDMDFLADVEEDIVASQHDYGLSGALNHALNVLKRLETEQKERLSQAPPLQLALVARPTGAERELARAAAACLGSMAARVAPKHVASVPALRRAMGVTLDHLDTPMSLDDFIELEMTCGDMGKQTSTRASSDTKSDSELKREDIDVK